MLTIENIDLHYGAAQALRGVSLTAETGKVTTVLGRNGVGKTTLLRAITGRQPISAGRMDWEGSDLSRLRAERPDDRIVWAELQRWVPQFDSWAIADAAANCGNGPIPYRIRAGCTAAVVCRR